MLDFLSKIFQRDKANSGSIARQRLQFVLIQDQSTISPEIMMKIKEEVIKVISKYIDIDRESSKIDFQKNSDMFALVASVPVKGFRRKGKNSNRKVRKLRKTLVD